MTDKVTFYSHYPTSLGEYKLRCPEMMAYLYLPIKMREARGFRIPENLRWTWPLIQAVNDEERLRDKYVYITAKHLYVQPGYTGNRPGYHGDGWGTDDVNYVWCDKFPTLFTVGQFVDVPTDDHASLSELGQQAMWLRQISGKPNHLYQLFPWNIHDVPHLWPDHEGWRTFVKISVSKHRYNLAGNSHNWLFDYDWKMWARDEVRNDPHYAGKDHYLDNPAGPVFPHEPKDN